jgi:DNA-binding NtrC family response regulator
MKMWMSDKGFPGAGGDPLIGESAPMRRLKAALAKMAGSEAPVLLTGESGTGKELAAQSIHRRSRRAAGPFVAVNCAALPPHLIASELFGHEKGAFTGADQRRIGRIQAAEGGTLFLDEIGDLPLELQAHLLRFLQESTVDPLGGRHPVKVDVRVVAATNVPLRRAVAEGRFREDLFYRLNVLTLEMPPLRDRPGDAEILARAFLARLAGESGRPVPTLGDEALGAIRAYPWPGNVRELMAALRRAAVMAEDDTIGAEDLGLDCLRPEPAKPLERARSQADATVIRKALAAHSENITRAARHLGISRVTLYRLMEKHKISTAGSQRRGGGAAQGEAEFA